MPHGDRTSDEDAPRVVVAGGGLAGLTAALRLAERGYQTTLYEQKPMLGGNLASRPAPSGPNLDVYPHMCPSWYLNFWRLVRDVTDVDREALFAPFSRVAQLHRGEYPRFAMMYGPTSVMTFVRNMFSGVQPRADMFLLAYATVDLLATALDPAEGLSVDGFLQRRGYVTERVASATDAFITRVWAIRSHLTSAEDYRTFCANSTAGRGPWLWMARGPAQQCVIEPLARALHRLGAEVVPGVQVSGISCTDGRVSEVTLRRVRFDPDTRAWRRTGEPWIEQVDELVLAVPPMQLSQLLGSAEPGHRIIEADPAMAGVSRLRAEPVPMVHLYLNHKLDDIPPEPVALVDSRLCLSFIDISQTWDDVEQFAGRTVLALAASNPDALPGTGWEDDAMAMFAELGEFIDIGAGTRWGESREIDWNLTRYDDNGDALLYVNEAGTDHLRPSASCEGVSNLSFAGDFCRSRVGMTTLESAVTTGLEAARLVVERWGLGTPVEVQQPVTRPIPLYVWLRYAWAPYAYAAKGWSLGSDHARSVVDRISQLSR